MKKYYLGLDFYDKNTYELYGCQSWERNKPDFSYESLEEIRKKIITLYKEEYEIIKSLTEDERKEHHLSIYSVEVKDGDGFKPIQYFLPPQKIIELLGIKWRSDILDRDTPPYLKKMVELFVATKAEMITLEDELLNSI